MQIRTAVFHPPLAHRAVLAASGIQECIGVVERNVGDMTGMSTIGAILRLWVERWVSKQLDQTVIVSGGENLARFALCYRVNVSAVDSRWPNALDAPAQNAGLGSPNGVAQVG